MCKHVSGWHLTADSVSCAELHEKQAELWDSFSKEARSNKALAPYWELLAMYDGKAKEGGAGQNVQRDNSVEL